jgi:alkylation response protein AidB-like acyl-CoA dehydrogenase
MSVSEQTAQPDYLTKLEQIINEVIAPAAVEIDTNGAFPRAALDALGQAGLLGLISSREVGGLGQAHRAAAQVVERIALECASTAMVVCMHYCGTAAIEAFGPRAVRKEIAAGRHVSTLAFSESGSRSNFWAPVSSATRVAEGVRLDAHKSWATSAGQADSYVWSSRSISVEGQSAVWLVPTSSKGLSVPTPFNGLGMRGNYSSPVIGDGVVIPSENLLGKDGGGAEVMLGVVLPYFQVMNAACAVGIMEAATTKAVAHVSGTRLTHTSQALADLPTVRAYLARMRIKTDQARALLYDTVAALEAARADATLRVLEVKAAAGESANEVTDLAMRVCGGAAYRKEVGVERHFRDARASTVMAPTADALYDFIGRVLCGMPLFD